MNWKHIHRNLTAAAHRTRRPLLWSATLGVLLLLNACYAYEEDPRSGATVPLTFYVQTTAEQHATRAYVGEVSSAAEEGAIKTLQVWLFDHDTPAMLLAYSDNSTEETPDEEHPNNDVRKVTLNVPEFVVTQNRSVDLYAIANGESAGLSLTGTATEAALEAAQLGNTLFTPTSKTQTVPTTGLPFATVKKGWSITEADGTTGNYKIKETLGQVKLTRAVSKVRFLFSRKSGINEAEITGIQLKGNFPTEQLILPDFNATDNFTSPYEGDKVVHLATDNYNITDDLVYGSTVTGDDTTAKSTTAIIDCKGEGNVLKLGVCEQPSNFIYTADETAQGYENRINDAITAGQLTDYGSTYLHETDKQLTGTIYYRMKTDGTIGTTDFTMAAEGDFVRNHTWTVYAYFEGDHLEVVCVYITPWKDGGTDSHEVYNW